MFLFTDVRDELAGNLGCIYDKLDGSKWYKQVYCRDKHIHPQTMAEVSEISRHLNTSKYIFLEDVMPFLEFYTPKEGQEIVQLWHAAGAYKKFGFSRTESGLRVSRGHEKYTKAVVSSESIADCYADAYHIPVGNIIATGVPRTDIFFDEEWKTNIRNKFISEHPQFEGKKIILFAPTYRGTKISDAGYDMNMLPMSELKEALSDDYVFITKWHPAMYNNMTLNGTEFKDNDFYIDMSYVRDVNDILPVADILVTDYSSLIFEWSLMNRPIVFYVHDQDEYADSRGLYYPFEDYVYGPVAKTPSELITSIKSAQVEEEKRTAFINRFMDKCDGTATLRIIKLLD